MKSEQHLVSIIVPVYNIEKYVSACIESLVNQTYKNLQIILVDDGATDNSGKICDEWANKHSKIEVVHKLNGGLSDARNAGIDNAKGRYIFFVDGDDYVLPDYIEKIMNCDPEIPFIGCSYYNLLSAGEKTETVFLNCEFSINEFKQQILTDASKVHFITVWGVRYLASYIKKYQIRFDVSAKAWEDINFNIQYLSHCDRVLSTELKGYIYRHIEGSLMHQFYMNKLIDTINESKMLEEFLNSDVRYMRLKLYYWHRVLDHYYKYYFRTGSKSLKREIKIKVNETYRNEYFRRCISYFRKYGSIDEKLETFLMGWHRHKIYKVLLNGLKIWGEVQKVLN